MNCIVSPAEHILRFVGKKAKKMFSIVLIVVFSSDDIDMIRVCCMNRKFKFRAMWKDTKKWIPDFMGNFSLDALNDDAFIVVQSTGITDKDGKEIYDGDILSFKKETNRTDKGVNRVGIVRYVKETLKWEFKDTTNWRHSLLEISEPIVIGNIYENPKLLKKVRLVAVKGERK